MNLKNVPLSTESGSGLLGVKIRDYLVEFTENEKIPVIGGEDLKGSWKQENDKGGVAFLSKDIPEEDIVRALAVAFGKPNEFGKGKDAQYVIPAYKVGASVWVSKREDTVNVLVVKPIRF